MPRFTSLTLLVLAGCASATSKTPDSPGASERPAPGATASEAVAGTRTDPSDGPVAQVPDAKAGERKLRAERWGDQLLQEKDDGHRAISELKSLGEDGRRQLKHAAEIYAEKVEKLGAEKFPLKVIDKYVHVLRALTGADIDGRHVSCLRVCLVTRNVSRQTLLSAIKAVEAAGPGLSAAALPELKQLRDDKKAPVQVSVAAMEAMKRIQGE
jgi:hypothetical protein